MRGRHLLAGLLAVFGCSVLPLLASETIQVQDAFDANRILNPENKISVIIYSNPALQEKTREAGKAVNGFLGRSDYQLIVLVDLRGTLAGWARGYTCRRMQRDLKAKIEKLPPRIREFDGGDWPRPDITVVPDFDGDICRQLGWDEPADQSLRVVVYDRGRRFKNWDNLKDHGLLVETVEGLIND